MITQRLVQQRVFLCCFGLHVVSSFLVGSTSSPGQDLVSSIKTAQSSKSGNTPLPSGSSHSTNEVVKPSIIRNRRSNLFSENEPLYDNNADLNSAFLYNDQIMQNLLTSPSSKPLSYAHTNFFLNYLKPRTTRYNAWDDHSLMHFGKRSLENDISNDKVLVKRSTDFWSPNNVLHFGKKAENLVKGNEFPDNAFDVKVDDFESDGNVQTKNSEITDSSAEKEYSEKDNMKKSVDPWHSMMSFGKKSQSPWDHNTLHFGKKNDLQNDLNLDKRSENIWDHNTMHFGKKDEPWHSMMSFGKKSDPWHSMMSFGKKSDNLWDHNTLHFGKKDEPWHNIMSFGKRSENPWDHNTLHFGKRDPWDHNTLHFGKRDPWDHNTLHFGKRDPWDHNTLHFGKRDPWDHNTLHFGKRDPWDHNTLHFGKRDPWDHNTLHFGKRDPWDHNTLHFGKRDEPWHNIMSFGKRSDPWHNMMSFGKKSDGFWDHNTLHFGKRDDPWHNMMSFGKRASDLWDHNTLHFGKKDDPWHSMMSFGKRSENSDMTDLEKREDPWHNMMSFGKKYDGLWNNITTVVDKREEPWHSMMSFGKKADYGFDHNTLHFGKRDDPWHNMMSFGKKSDSLWDHNTLHFGKKDEPWHSMMSFGKKSDPLSEKFNLALENGNYPMNSIMNSEKRLDGSIDDLSEDFSGNFDPWYEYDGMMFYKKSSPWDHNTLHFGKKSNSTFESSLPEENPDSNHIQKRSIDMWNDHHTMHFGKKFDPWDNHNTMHFGKKSDSVESNVAEDFEKKELDDFNKVENIEKKFDWDSHNTMHFGKRDLNDYQDTFSFDKRDPWDYYNTMHFGKRNPWDHHNTMHFGKRDPWAFHDTMHFGKRNPWENYNTMHFGKRNPWEQHNTMHFGKRSDLDLEDKSISFMDKSNNPKDVKISNTENTKDTFDRKTDKNELSITKRSPGDSKTNNNSKNIKRKKEIADKASDNPKFSSQIETNVKQSRENFKSIPALKNEEKNINDNSAFVNSNKRQVNNKKSHVQKRSIDTSSFMNEDSNAHLNLANKYAKDDIADNVLHFGKRSVEVTNDNEEQLFDEENEKRFDEFWNDHNTLHFGKKSDFWDNHNTLHFGKRSSPQLGYSVIPFEKKDPWEHLSTLHFGKKFDPWDGHAKMHFGKRADGWDHNVMHFGKRNELPPEEFEVLSNLDDADLLKLKDYIQSISTEQDDNTYANDFLDNLSILKSIISSKLKDDSIPFEDRVNLVKQYLKPVIKAIIDTEESESIPSAESNDNSNEHVKDYNEDEENTLGTSITIPLNLINKMKYPEAVLKNENDDSSYGEYGDKSKKPKYSNEFQNVKSKRKYLGRAEFKRYFVPFQGPKSIVYPHAWFASQIRRSSLPRTTDYARHMEMRMAEKKEDPFNSYMHFGRR